MDQASFHTVVTGRFKFPSASQVADLNARAAVAASKLEEVTRQLEDRERADSKRCQEQEGRVG